MKKIMIFQISSSRILINPLNNLRLKSSSGPYITSRLEPPMRSTPPTSTATTVMTSSNIYQMLSSTLKYVQWSVTYMCSLYHIYCHHAFTTQKQCLSSTYILKKDHMQGLSPFVQIFKTKTRLEGINPLVAINHKILRLEGRNPKVAYIKKKKSFRTATRKDKWICFQRSHIFSAILLESLVLFPQPNQYICYQSYLGYVSSHICLCT